MAGRNSGQLGVDVCVESLDNPDTPHCPHGPTLLFERYIKGGESRERFYACSACRDRKGCSFYQLEGQTISTEKKKAREIHNRTLQPVYSHAEYWQRRERFDNLKVTQKKFCRTCGLLLIKTERELHEDHVLVDIAKSGDLSRPSRLLAPLENKKSNAQFLFSQDCLNFMLGMLGELRCSRLLCVGTPSIHEAICRSSTPVDDLLNAPRQSMLLDIDYRYGQFFGPKEFARYNMFNNHFFEKSEGSPSELFDGAGSDTVALVMDPPFGGLVDVLAHNVKKFMSLWDEHQQKKKAKGEPVKELLVFWVFPYFMEPRILQRLPSFSMLDYKVDYANHDVFKSKEQKGSKHGSPVRIFTNVSPSKITLPQDKGYKWCSICQKFVSKENSHCMECNACTSKDGHRYVHCEKCERCVKPSRVHCDKCAQCLLPKHVCGQELKGCHICGKDDHKRRECPERFNPERKKIQKKRLSQETDKSAESVGRQKRKLHNNERKIKKKKAKFSQ